MLSRYLIFNHEQGKSVWFKYTKPDEFIESGRRTIQQIGEIKQEVRSPSQKQKHRGLRKSLGLHYTEELSEEETLDLVSKNVVDLGSDSGLAGKLFKGFLRAKEAARIGMTVSRSIRLRGPKRALRQSMFDMKIILAWFYGKFDLVIPVSLASDIEEIERNFKRTFDGLNSECVVISDTAGRYGFPGYTIEKRVDGQLTGTFGNIHIHFMEHKNHPADFAARTILHEATHKFCGTEDIPHGYSFNGRPLLTNSEMPKNDLPKNADSYALAGISLLNGKLLTHASLS